MPRPELLPRPPRPPWLTLAVAAAALGIQCMPGWRESLVYDRAALAEGDWWRAWTGHLVHFGWPHFLVDTGLLLFVGCFAEWRHPRFTRLGLGLMPAIVSAVLFWLEPGMTRYAGLSALNLGFLLYVALQGWRQDRREWFWPAVVALYGGELALEHFQGGRGGGAIRFDEPGVRIATGAHLTSAAYALLALGFGALWRRFHGIAPRDQVTERSCRRGR